MPSLKIISGCLAGIVIVHALFQIGDQLAARLDRNVSISRKAGQRQQCFYFQRFKLRLFQCLPQLILVFRVRQRSSGGIQLLAADIADMILPQGIQRLTHLVVAGECRYFFFLFAGFCRLLPAIPHHVEPCFFRQCQRLADPGKIQLVRLAAHRKQYLSLCRCQRAAGSVFRNADMIDFLQQRKIFKREGRLACPLLALSLQRAGADPVAAAIRAAFARTFRKGALACQNTKVLCLHLRRSPCRTVLTLCCKNQSGLVYDLVAFDGGKIIFRFVALVLCKHRVAVHHLTDSTVPVCLHTSGVRVNCLQQLTVFLCIVCLAVTAKAPALHQVQQYTGKIQCCHRAIQRLNTQRIDIRQMSRLHSLLYFRLTGQTVFLHQLVQIRLAQAAAAQPAAGAAGLTARGSKAVACFGLFGLIKYA